MSSLRIIGLVGLLAAVGCGGGNTARPAAGTSQVTAPSGLAYASPVITAMVGTAITPDTPTLTGTAPAYAIVPALPAGLSLDASTGVISGTPTAASARTLYTITATNGAGFTSATVIITVGTPGLNLVTPRGVHTATLLEDGRVLVAGGFVSNGPSSFVTATAEMVDPAKNQVLPMGSMVAARARHTATRLADGRVLIAGGCNLVTDYALDSAEIFDPATGLFSATGSMVLPRSRHTATLLKDGRVFIAGGDGPNPDQVYRAPEIFDPATGRFELVPSPWFCFRTLHCAALLDSGNVLIAGGVEWSRCTWDTAEVYDPMTHELRLLDATLSGPCASPQATRLSSGKILLTYIAANSGESAADLFDPAVETFSPTGAPALCRDVPTLSSLSQGGALIIGGNGGIQSPGAYYAAMEKYDESTGCFQPAGALAQPRCAHTATLLEDGRILVIGGYNGNPLSLTEIVTPD